VAALGARGRPSDPHRAAPLGRLLRDRSVVREQPRKVGGRHVRQSPDLRRARVGFLSATGGAQGGCRTLVLSGVLGWADLARKRAHGQTQCASSYQMLLFAWGKRWLQGGIVKC